MVNGAWIGCCESALMLTNKYRSIRRQGKEVSPTTTICWNPINDEIRFLLDVGRMIRPLVIVYNNIAEVDKTKDISKFKQWTKVDAAVMAGIKSGEVTLDWMILNGLTSMYFNRILLMFVFNIHM